MNAVPKYWPRIVWSGFLLWQILAELLSAKAFGNPDTSDYNGCQYELFIDDTDRYITSPNYPSSYPAFADCAWVLNTTAANRIEVHFLTFDTEKCCDRLTIHGAAEEIELKGNHTGKIVTSTGSSIVLKFLADGDTDSIGFSARIRRVGQPETLPEYKRHPECGRDITVTKQGNISSPGFPTKYPSDLDCWWRLVTEDESDHILIEFNHVQTENCCDYVKVYDGSKLLTRLRGTYNYAPIYSFTSSGNSIRIHFHSDSTTEMQGFSAEYIIVSGMKTTPTTGVPSLKPSSECGGELYASATPVPLYTPGWPGAYEINTMCSWKIYAARGTQVELTIHFVELNECCDYIEINLIGRNSTSTVVINSLSMKTSYNSPEGGSIGLSFISRGFMPRRGFRATYTAIDIISTPSPSPTPYGVRCEEPKIFAACATKCPPTCDDPEPEFCSRACDPNVICVCPPGMVQLSKEDRTCLQRADCPVKCEEPKVFAACATFCPRTCDDLNPKVCLRGCDPRVICVCPPHMVQLSKEDRTCLYPADCPVDTTAAPYTHSAVSTTATPYCEEPKIFAPCATKCPRTCDDPEPDFCSYACDPNVICVCPPGMVQLSKEDRTCLYLADCPVLCEEPKIFAPCATKCPPTCNDPEPEFCSRACDPNVICVCPPGMVQLSKEDRTCVMRTDCPADTTAAPYTEAPVSTTATVYCEEPTVFAPCATKCPRTCDDPEPDFCSRACDPNVICVCPPDMVQLSKEDRTCLYLADCPVLCEEPKIFAPCATKCPPTCNDPEPEFCSRACDPNVICVCPPGMVQLSKEDRTCLKREDCPVYCEEPKIFAPCATKCPRTCDDPEPDFCSRACDPNVVCVCPPDMVQLSKEDRTCLQLADCPVKCEDPKIFAPCASKCPRTCDDPEPEYCSRACDPNVLCVCPPHMVQYSKENRTCLELEECEAVRTTAVTYAPTAPTTYTEPTELRPKNCGETNRRIEPGRNYTLISPDKKNVECQWRFRALSGFYIKFTFHEFDVGECCGNFSVYQASNYQSVWDSENLLQQVSGLKPSNYEVTVKSDIAGIVFVAKSLEANFKIGIESVLQIEPKRQRNCAWTNRRISYGKQYRIVSPGNDNITCRWRFRAARGLHIKFTFIEFDVFNCCGNFSVYEAKSYSKAWESENLLQRISGAKAPGYELVAKSYMAGIAFVSTSLNAKFIFTYESIPPEGESCGFLANAGAKSRRIGTPGWPRSPYLGELNCTWVLRGEYGIRKGQVRLVLLALEIQSDGDKLVVYDGDSSRMEFSSSIDEQISITSTEGYLKVHYYAKASELRKGFSADYVWVKYPDTTASITTTATATATSFVTSSAVPTTADTTTATTDTSTTASDTTSTGATTGTTDTTSTVKYPDTTASITTTATKTATSFVTSSAVRTTADTATATTNTTASDTTSTGTSSGTMDTTSSVTTSTGVKAGLQCYNAVVTSLSTGQSGINKTNVEMCGENSVCLLVNVEISAKVSENSPIVTSETWYASCNPELDDDAYSCEQVAETLNLPSGLFSGWKIESSKCGILLCEDDYCNYQRSIEKSVMKMPEKPTSVPDSGTKCYEIIKSVLLPSGTVAINSKMMKMCPTGSRCLLVQTNATASISEMPDMKIAVTYGSCVEEAVCSHNSCSDLPLASAGLPYDLTFENCDILCCDDDLCNDDVAITIATSVSTATQAPDTTTGPSVPDTTVKYPDTTASITTTATTTATSFVRSSAVHTTAETTTVSTDSGTTASDTTSTGTSSGTTDTTSSVTTSTGIPTGLQCYNALVISVQGQPSLNRTNVEICGKESACLLVNVEIMAKASDDFTSVTSETWYGSCSPKSDYAAYSCEQVAESFGLPSGLHSGWETESSKCGMLLCEEDYCNYPRPIEKSVMKASEKPTIENGTKCHDIIKSVLLPSGTVAINSKTLKSCPIGSRCMLVQADASASISEMQDMKVAITYGSCVDEDFCSHDSCADLPLASTGLPYDLTFENCDIRCCDDDFCNDDVAVTVATSVPTLTTATRAPETTTEPLVPDTTGTTAGLQCYSSVVTSSGGQSIMNRTIVEICGKDSVCLLVNVETTAKIDENSISVTSETWYGSCSPKSEEVAYSCQQVVESLSLPSELLSGWKIESSKCGTLVCEEDFCNYPRSIEKSPIKIPEKPTINNGTKCYEIIKSVLLPSGTVAINSKTVKVCPTGSRCLLVQANASASLPEMPDMNVAITYGSCVEEELCSHDSCADLPLASSSLPYNLSFETCDMICCSRDFCNDDVSLTTTSMTTLPNAVSSQETMTTSIPDTTTGARGIECYDVLISETLMGKRISTKTCESGWSCLFADASALVDIRGETVKVQVIYGSCQPSSLCSSDSCGLLTDIAPYLGYDVTIDGCSARCCNDDLCNDDFKMTTTSPPYTTPGPVFCEEPKIFAACASKCPPTCEDPYPVYCSRACDPNVLCVCPPGMVQLSKQDRTCVELAYCSRPTQPVPYEMYCYRTSVSEAMGVVSLSEQRAMKCEMDSVCMLLVTKITITKNYTDEPLSMTMNNVYGSCISKLHLESASCMQVLQNLGPHSTIPEEATSLVDSCSLSFCETNLCNDHNGPPLPTHVPSVDIATVPQIQCYAITMNSQYEEQISTISCFGEASCYLVQAEIEIISAFTRTTANVTYGGCQQTGLCGYNECDDLSSIVPSSVMGISSVLWQQCSISCCDEDLCNDDNGRITNRPSSTAAPTEVTIGGSKMLKCYRTLVGESVGIKSVNEQSIMDCDEDSVCMLIVVQSSAIDEKNGNVTATATHGSCFPASAVSSASCNDLLVNMGQIDSSMPRGASVDNCKLSFCTDNLCNDHNGPPLPTHRPSEENTGESIECYSITKVDTSMRGGSQSKISMITCPPGASCTLTRARVSLTASFFDIEMNITLGGCQASALCKYNDCEQLSSLMPDSLKGLSDITIGDCQVSCCEEDKCNGIGIEIETGIETTATYTSAIPTTTAPMVYCEEPKIFAPCATKCPPTCDNPEPDFCSRVCDPNVICVCPPGMVQLSKEDRTCLKLSDCPGDTTTPYVTTVTSATTEKPSSSRLQCYSTLVTESQGANVIDQQSAVDCAEGSVCMLVVVNSSLSIEFAYDVPASTVYGACFPESVKDSTSCDDVLTNMGNVNPTLSSAAVKVQSCRLSFCTENLCNDHKGAPLPEHVPTKNVTGTPIRCYSVSITRSSDNLAEGRRLQVVDEITCAAGASCYLTKATVEFGSPVLDMNMDVVSGGCKMTALCPYDDCKSLSSLMPSSVAGLSDITVVNCTSTCCGEDLCNNDGGSIHKKVVETTASYGTTGVLPTTSLIPEVTTPGRITSECYHTISTWVVGENVINQQKVMQCEAGSVCMLVKVEMNVITEYAGKTLAKTYYGSCFPESARATTSCEDMLTNMGNVNVPGSGANVDISDCALSFCEGNLCNDHSGPPLPTHVPIVNVTGNPIECYHIKKTESLFSIIIQNERSKITCAAGASCYLMESSLVVAAGQLDIEMDVVTGGCVLSALCGYSDCNSVESMAPELMSDIANITVKSCMSQCCTQDLCNNDLDDVQTTARVETTHQQTIDTSTPTVTPVTTATTLEVSTSRCYHMVSTSFMARKSGNEKSIMECKGDSVCMLVKVGVHVTLDYGGYGPETSQGTTIYGSCFPASEQETTSCEDVLTNMGKTSPSEPESDIEVGTCTLSFCTGDLCNDHEGPELPIHEPTSKKTGSPIECYLISKTESASKIVNKEIKSKITCAAGASCYLTKSNIAIRYGFFYIDMVVVSGGCKLAALCQYDECDSMSSLLSGTVADVSDIRIDGCASTCCAEDLCNDDAQVVLPEEVTTTAPQSTTYFSTARQTTDTTTTYQVTGPGSATLKCYQTIRSDALGKTVINQQSVIDCDEGSVCVLVKVRSLVTLDDAYAGYNGSPIPTTSIFGSCFPESEKSTTACEDVLSNMGNVNQASRASVKIESCRLSFCSGNLCNDHDGPSLPTHVPSVNATGMPVQCYTVSKTTTSLGIGDESKISKTTCAVGASCYLTRAKVVAGVGYLDLDMEIVSGGCKLAALCGYNECDSLSSLMPSSVYGLSNITVEECMSSCCEGDLCNSADQLLTEETSVLPGATAFVSTPQPTTSQAANETLQCYQTLVSETMGIDPINQQNIMDCNADSVCMLVRVESVVNMDGDNGGYDGSIPATTVFGSCFPESETESTSCKDVLTNMGVVNSISEASVEVQSCRLSFCRGNLCNDHAGPPLPTHVPSVNVTGMPVQCYAVTKVKTSLGLGDRNNVSRITCDAGASCYLTVAKVAIGVAILDLDMEIVSGGCKLRGLCEYNECDTLSSLLPSELGYISNITVKDCVSSCCEGNFCNNDGIEIPVEPTEETSTPLTTAGYLATDVSTTSQGDRTLRCYQTMLSETLGIKAIDQQSVMECNEGSVCMLVNVEVSTTYEDGNYGGTPVKTTSVIASCFPEYAIESTSCKDVLGNMGNINPGPDDPMEIGSCRLSFCRGSLCNDHNGPPLPTHVPSANATGMPVQCYSVSKTSTSLGVGDESKISEITCGAGASCYLTRAKMETNVDLIDLDMEIVSGGCKLSALCGYNECDTLSSLLPSSIIGLSDLTVKECVSSCCDGDLCNNADGLLVDETSASPKATTAFVATPEPTTSQDLYPGHRNLSCYRTMLSETMGITAIDQQSVMKCDEGSVCMLVKVEVLTTMEEGYGTPVRGLSMIGSCFPESAKESTSCENVLANMGNVSPDPGSSVEIKSCKLSFCSQNLCNDHNGPPLPVHITTVNVTGNPVQCYAVTRTGTSLGVGNQDKIFQITCAAGASCYLTRARAGVGVSLLDINNISLAMDIVSGGCKLSALCGYDECDTLSSLMPDSLLGVSDINVKECVSSCCEGDFCNDADTFLVQPKEETTTFPETATSQATEGRRIECYAVSKIQTTFGFADEDKVDLVTCAAGASCYLTEASISFDVLGIDIKMGIVVGGCKLSALCGYNECDSLSSILPGTLGDLSNMNVTSCMSSCCNENLCNNADGPVVEPEETTAQPVTGGIFETHKFTTPEGKGTRPGRLKCYQTISSNSLGESVISQQNVMECDEDSVCMLLKVEAYVTTEGLNGGPSLTAPSTSIFGSCFPESAKATTSCEGVLTNMESIQYSDMQIETCRLSFCDTDMCNDHRGPPLPTHVPTVNVTGKPVQCHSITKTVTFYGPIDQSATSIVTCDAGSSCYLTKAKVAISVKSIDMHMDIVSGGCRLSALCGYDECESLSSLMPGDVADLSDIDVKACVSKCCEGDLCNDEASLDFPDKRNLTTASQMTRVYATLNPMLTQTTRVLATMIPTRRQPTASYETTSPTITGNGSGRLKCYQTISYESSGKNEISIQNVVECNEGFVCMLLKVEAYLTTEGLFGGPSEVVLSTSVFGSCFPESAIASTSCEGVLANTQSIQSSVSGSDMRIETCRLSFCNTDMCNDHAGPPLPTHVPTVNVTGKPVQCHSITKTVTFFGPGDQNATSIVTCTAGSSCYLTKAKVAISVESIDMHTDIMTGGCRLSALCGYDECESLSSLMPGDVADLSDIDVKACVSKCCEGDLCNDEASLEFPDKGNMTTVPQSTRVYGTVNPMLSQTTRVLATVIPTVIHTTGSYDKTGSTIRDGGLTCEHGFSVSAHGKAISKARSLKTCQDGEVCVLLTAQASTDDATSEFLIRYSDCAHMSACESTDCSILGEVLPYGIDGSQLQECTRTCCSTSHCNIDGSFISSTASTPTTTMGLSARFELMAHDTKFFQHCSLQDYLVRSWSCATFMLNRVTNSAECSQRTERFEQCISSVQDQCGYHAYQYDPYSLNEEDRQHLHKVIEDLQGLTQLNWINGLICDANNPRNSTELRKNLAALCATDGVNSEMRMIDLYISMLLKAVETDNVVDFCSLYTKFRQLLSGLITGNDCSLSVHEEHKRDVLKKSLLVFADAMNNFHMPLCLGMDQNGADVMLPDLFPSGGCPEKKLDLALLVDATRKTTQRKFEVYYKDVAKFLKNVTNGLVHGNRTRLVVAEFAHRFERMYSSLDNSKISSEEYNQEHFENSLLNLAFRGTTRRKFYHTVHAAVEELKLSSRNDDPCTVKLIVYILTGPPSDKKYIDTAVQSLQLDRTYLYVIGTPPSKMKQKHIQSFLDQLQNVEYIQTNSVGEALKPAMEFIFSHVPDARRV